MSDVYSASTEDVHSECCHHMSNVYAASATTECQMCMLLPYNMSTAYAFITEYYYQMFMPQQVCQMLFKIPSTHAKSDAYIK